MSDPKDLKLLGNKKTVYPKKYDPSCLEVFDNRHPEKDSWVSLICPEFTSLCPVTDQPDFASIYINYIADEKMVESKSLKLYLFSFRNHGDFHENCINTILDDLFNLMQPRYIEVTGRFSPRGGIAIHPFASKSNGSKQYERLKDDRMKLYQPEGLSSRL